MIQPNKSSTSSAKHAEYVCLTHRIEIKIWLLKWRQKRAIHFGSQSYIAVAPSQLNAVAQLETCDICRSKPPTVRKRGEVTTTLLMSSQALGYEV